MKNFLTVVLILLAGCFPLPLLAVQTSVPLKPIYQHGRWGYADANGKLAIEPRFDAALPFNEGLARVGVVDEELPEIDGRPNILWGYIDKTGSVVVALRYNALRGFAEGLAACGVLDPDLANRSVFVRRGLNNFKWGYVNREGREIIPLKFFAAGDFSEGLAAVDVGGERDGSCDRNHQYGYLDKTGTIVIKPRFAGAGPFKNGTARVSIGHTTYEGRCLCCAPRFVGRSGLVDLKGEFVGDGKSVGEDSIPDPDGREMR